MAITPGQERVLRGAHFLAGTLHVGTTVFLLGFGPADPWRPPLRWTYDYWDEKQCQAPDSSTLVRCFEQSPREDTNYELHLLAVLCCASAWSGLVHFAIIQKFISLPRLGIGFGAYLAELQRGVSTARWLDYALSASLMAIAIAAASGVVEVWLLAEIFLCEMVVVCIGYFSEKYSDARLFSGASVYYLLGVWVPISVTFLKSVESTPESPDALWAVIVVLFSTFSTFASIAAFKIYRPLSNYGCEIAYIGASLIAKWLLHWSQYLTVLARKNDYTVNSVQTDVVVPETDTTVYIVITSVPLAGILITLFILWRWQRAMTVPENGFLNLCAVLNALPVPFVGWLLYVACRRSGKGSSQQGGVPGSKASGLQL